MNVTFYTGRKSSNLIWVPVVECSSAWWFVNLNAATQSDLKYMTKVVWHGLIDMKHNDSIKNLKKGMYEMVNSSPFFIFRLALKEIVFPNSPKTFGFIRGGAN